jgi:hypothetical protein
LWRAWLPEWCWHFPCAVTRSRTSESFRATREVRALSSRVANPWRPSLQPHVLRPAAMSRASRRAHTAVGRQSWPKRSHQIAKSFIGRSRANPVKAEIAVRCHFGRAICSPKTE